ncbi:hypothetical protein [Devosia lacusdianchii]|uniref:hypothetical protein n=1 Tax=Devosia lacusdianchii TaxID=2917991 RepID=UPI001F057923|nr:hypothetical protein [Devosia sp. JXJ CY 41]
MTKRPPEQRRNSYEDSDFAQVLAEIEEMDEEIATIQATAAGKIGGVKTRKANRIKIAKQELGIPTDVLKTVLKQRGLERQIAKLTAGVPDDLVEVYVDAAGQFSFLKPDEAHPQDNAAQVAARQRQAEIDKVTEAEKQQGAEVLDELTKH